MANWESVAWLLWEREFAHCHRGSCRPQPAKHLSTFLHSQTQTPTNNCWKLEKDRTNITTYISYLVILATPSLCCATSFLVTPRWVSQRFARTALRRSSAFMLDHDESLSRTYLYEAWHGRHFHWRPYFTASVTGLWRSQSIHLR